MAGSYNCLTIIGHVGRDPETRIINPDGQIASDFSVATSERRRDRDGGMQEKTVWFRVSTFGKLAEVCSEYVHKGSYVYVEGPLSIREYTTKDGRPGTSLEVRARELRLLDKRGNGEGVNPAGEPALSTAGAAPADLDLSGDLPF